MRYLMKSKFFTESKKYLKTYESVCSLPKIGQYAIIDYEDTKKFGKIVFISDHTYIISTNINDQSNTFDNTFIVDINKILYWSDNKDDIEIYIDKDKYNL